MLKFLGYLFQLVISPAKGWEDIARAEYTPQQLASEGFYPLIGITACSEFIQKFYIKTLSIPTMIEDALITFIGLFISYFFGSFLFALFGKRFLNDQPDEKRYNTFIMYNLSLLSLITLLRNCMPTDLSIVQFLPVLVLLVMWMGAKYVNVQSGKMLVFIVFCAGAILIPPYVFGAFFKLLLPI